MLQSVPPGQAGYAGLFARDAGQNQAHLRLDERADPGSPVGGELSAAPRGRPGSDDHPLPGRKPERLARVALAGGVYGGQVHAGADDHGQGWVQTAFDQTAPDGPR